jgi:ABC-2 type transport system ATP-binding protein
LGFLGPNGAGKSTVMKIMTGYLAADDGNVLFDDLSIRDHANSLRQLIGYLPASNPLYPNMYVREFLSFAASLCAVKGIKERVEKVVEEIGLKDHCGKKIKELSKGYKQRVGIAQALIHDPKYLIFDEPISGLDPNQLVELREIFQELSKTKSILLSSHILQEIEAICDRIVVINKGEIAAQGQVDDLKYRLRSGHRLIVRFKDSVDMKPYVTHLKESDFEKAGERILSIQSKLAPDDLAERVFKIAIEQKDTILEMKMQDRSLEELFGLLTKRN